MQNQKNCILSTAYFGNIEYFSKLLKYENVLIEKHENYQKRTFRNRFQILSANGVLNLSIPVKRSNELKTQIDKIQIDYSENWQKNHLKSLESAYKSSPFYEYYIDEIIDFLNIKYDNLFEHNTLLTKLIAENINLKFDYKFTEKYITNYENNIDFRNIISPKNKNSDFKIEKYYQTFYDKFPFTPNLSILDLIFNEGPQSLDILQKTNLVTL